MRTVGVLIIVAALAAGGWYGRQYLNHEPEGPAYVLGEVARGDLRATVMATGTLEPLVKVLVGSQVSGTVVHWYTDFNAEVKAGDVLAELDQERIQATIDQRSAALAVARARADEQQALLANAALQRKQLESARAATSPFELESARISEQAAQAALTAARAEVQAAEADLEQAKVELTKTIIRSPIDGVVISRDIDEGQTVAASLQAPTLFTIANDLRRLRVNAAVSETDVGRIREGMPAEFRVDAYPGRTFRGTVTQVRYAETVIENVVTYQTLIDVENPDLALRPGMTATINFEVAKAENVLYVPNAALRFDPENPPTLAAASWKPARAQAPRPRVFKLASGQPVEVPVELGINSGSETAIVSDQIAEGDSIIVDWDLARMRLGGVGGPRRGPF